MILFIVLSAENLRDYKADVEAIVASKPPSWKLSHFGLWTDLIEIPQETVPTTSAADLQDLEEQAHQAKYREIRAKLAQDLSSMTQYHAAAAESKRRLHVVHVMHERGQAEVGKECLVQIILANRF